MSNLESKFNSATDFLGVVSLGSVVLSGILLFTPVKAIGYIGVGSGLGAFAASIISRKKHLKIAESEISSLVEIQTSEKTIHTQLLLKKDNEITAFKTNFSNGFKRIEELTEESSKLQNQVVSLTAQNQSKDNIIEKVTGELDRQITIARTAIEESLDEWKTKLISLVDSKKERYPKLKERLNELKDEGIGKLAEYTEKLVQTPSKWDSLGDLLSLYYCLNDDLSNIKTKIIQSIARLTNQETQLELQEVEEILEEWQTANLIPRDKLEHIIRNYESALNEFRMDYSKRFEGVYQFATALEGQTQEDDKYVQGIIAKMQELEAKIQYLSRPLKYPGAIRCDMKIANIVIEYFERLGVILDRAGTNYRGYEATLEFNSDRTGRIILPKDLNEHSDRLQKLTHTLNSPEFVLEPETGLLTLVVRWANKPATDNKDTVKRLLTPLNDFVKKVVTNLSHKPTIRIMGATGEGKGVCARYLLSQIVLGHDWYIRLHDPQHGTPEDHWGIPKVSKTGDELKDALEQIMKQMVKRECQSWSVVTLDVLDEIDTHLEKKEKKESFIDLISRIRHLGMKLILIGQNPKVGRAGFEWSDMQQMNCIYMGTSAFDAIETNPQLKPRKDKLTKEYLTLSEHYEKTNEGLDDSEKYLFGLVVIPGKQPFWFELPRPDTIEITSNELLLGKSFTVPNSLINFVEAKITVVQSGNFVQTNSNLPDLSKAETFTVKGMEGFPDSQNYVGVAESVGQSGQAGLITCKKHPDAELTRYSDGRYKCPVCKKRLLKSEIEIR